jgi:hypothetical protein
MPNPTYATGTPTAQPPTVPVPPRTPVPPTQPLPPPTVPEQIVELLITRQEWLTSTEIAQALNMLSG